mmetsp:Transcript_16283/g.53026  ORF Transcript_16283/g.53026 Transcript_16283/m.53026 type:complete len:317 (+) Transcript_16283:462-1412(+)
MGNQIINMSDQVHSLHPSVVKARRYTLPIERTAGSTQEPPLKKGRSRKAANLAELQRYFTAAAEAASEVLQQAPEDSVLEGTEDLTRIAEAGIKPLDSPSRMVAVSLASGNANFREKLRQKLEASGGVACKIQIGSQKRCSSVDEDDLNDPKGCFTAAPVDLMSNPMRTSSLESPGLPHARARYSSMGSRKSRWRKKELSITIEEADNFSLVKANKSSKMAALFVGPSEDTPRQSTRQLEKVPWPGDSLDRCLNSYYSIHTCVCSPLSVERHTGYTFEHLSMPEAHYTIANASRPSSVLYSESLKFDFDEVVAHYP